MKVKIVSSILCSVIALFLVACEKEVEQNDKEPVIRPVKFLSISAASTTQVSRFPAVVGASRLSELSLSVGGKITELPIRAAQSVNQGDLLVKLDQRDFESALQSAKAQFENSETEYQRAVRLSEQDAIAQNVLEQRKANRDVSKTQLDQAKKAFEDSVLVAPFSGTIASVEVKKLQTVSAGAVLVNLISGDGLEASIDLPASYLATIPKNSSSSDSRRAFIFLDAAPNQIINARFKKASLLADTASQTYKITFEFLPPDNLIVLPGMNATVELRAESSQNSDRVAVPLEAIVKTEEKHFVWLINKADMTVSKRQVSIEDSVGKTVLVSEGLNSNDTIVAAGATYLSEGMRVKEWK